MTMAGFEERHRHNGRLLGTTKSDVRKVMTLTGILLRILIKNRYICDPGLLPDAAELRIDDFVKDFN